MKNTIAVMGAIGVFGGFFGVAQAHSTVAVFGFLDVGLLHESGGVKGTSTAIASGMSAGSRLGLRGNEDLGAGLSAHFVLESGFQADTGALGQGGLLFGRQGYVGLKGGFGAINAGLQYTPYYLALSFADPFVSGLTGKSSALMASSGARMDNTVKYNTPVFNGFSGEFAYRFGESASQRGAHGARIAYANGPLQVRLAHHNRNVVVAAGTALNAAARNTLLAVTYDFKIAKAYLGYAVNDGFGSSPFLVANPYGADSAPAASQASRDMIAGVSLPLGPHVFVASYVRKDDRDAPDRDASKMAIGYFYALSKRTTLYASYSRLDNDNGAAYTVATAIESGSGDLGANLGIAHAF